MGGEHIVGRRVGGLFGPTDKAAPDEARPEQSEQILVELLRSGRWDGILTLRHRDGHGVQVEARASLLVDGDGRPFVLASIVETSRLRTLEHDLAALDALLESSPLGVAIFDDKLRYTRINESLAELNGLPVADHIGRTVVDVLDPDFGSALMKLQRNVLATGHPVVDRVVRAPGGGGTGHCRTTGWSTGWETCSGSAPS